MRKKIAAGNWKMNKTYDEGIALAKAIIDNANPGDNLVIFCTPFVHLKAVSDLVKNVPNIHTAAQNCSEHESGAYTGETSVDMIKSVGADYVVIGHSERRQYHEEDNELLAAKVDLILEKGLKPIYCCGESLEIREIGSHVEFVGSQLLEGLFHLSAEEFSKVVIAYEPIWAIGTGVTASPAQAQEMQKELRQLIATQYGSEVADNTTILYGGSVKPANAKELFACPDVDGGLVGGASLKADSFVDIIHSF